MRFIPFLISLITAAIAVLVLLGVLSDTALAVAIIVLAGVLLGQLLKLLFYEK